MCGWNTVEWAEDVVCNNEGLVVVDVESWLWIYKLVSRSMETFRGDLERDREHLWSRFWFGKHLSRARWRTEIIKWVQSATVRREDSTRRRRWTRWKGKQKVQKLNRQAPTSSAQPRQRPLLNSLSVEPTMAELPPKAVAKLHRSWMVHSMWNSKVLDSTVPPILEHSNDIFEIRVMVHNPLETANKKAHMHGTKISILV